MKEKEKAPDSEIHTANILTLGELYKDGKGLILRRGKVR